MKKADELLIGNGMNNVWNILGKGLLIGIELVKDKTTKEPLENDLVNQVIAICKHEGIIIDKNGGNRCWI
jgi:taurine-pyruvate aminotransferase